MQDGEREGAMPVTVAENRRAEHGEVVYRKQYLINLNTISAAIRTN